MRRNHKGNRMTAATAKIRHLHAHRKEEEYEEKFRWDDDRGEAVRPFRLYDPIRRRNYRWRCYSDGKRAHMGALIEARWAGIGETIEVYDVRTGRLMGQYTRRVDSITFMGA
jgi:hypothetical protein